MELQLFDTYQREVRAFESIENNQVGHLTIGTWSPTLDTGIGYVRFDEPSSEGDWLGQTVFLQDDDGQLHTATVDLLPFVDKGKQLPRIEFG